MPQRAERVEALIRIDKIVIRLLLDGRIHLSDSRGKIRHNDIKALVQFLILIDAVLFFHHLKEFVAALAVIILHRIIHGGVLHAHLNTRPDDAAPTGLRC